MCRLLYVKSKNTFAIKDHLAKFADIAKNSKEYQGHGWGCVYLDQGEWKLYKNINPIWEQDFNRFESTTTLIAHARSAFQETNIHTDFNMPFIKGDNVYIFNGELHGVKIKETGKSGAEKIFNYIFRFYQGDIPKAIHKAVNIINKRSRYIKAMNFIIANKKRAYIYSQFHEDPKYFTLHWKKRSDELIISSEMYPGENNWEKIETELIKEF